MKEKLQKFNIWIATFMILVGGIFNAFIIQHKNSQLREVKNELLQRQVKYEELEKTNANLTQDLHDTNKRLAAAAAREKAARVRASRSRNQTVRNISTIKRTTPLFSGGLHDITMYCPTGNRTASGKWSQRGYVATISRSIPFGTRIRIEGLGEFVVEDRIGHGSEYDIFTPNCAEANRFGRERRRVTILDVN